MSSPGLTRRQLLTRGAAVGATAAMGGVVGGAARADEHPVIAGVVDRAEPPNILLLERSEGPAAVTFTEDATFWKDGPARLEDFIPGDEVTVEGDGTPQAFVGTFMVTTFRTIETQVESRDGPSLDTPAGRIEIVPETQVLGEHRSKRPEEIGRNDRVIAICRVDPSSSNLVALRIGVV